MIAPVRRVRHFLIAGGLAMLGLTAGTAQTQNPPASAPPPPQISQTPQTAPTFRAGVNLVTVDAYPIRDGKVVEGLTSDDFEVLEDGKPQKTESFEFVRVEPTPAAIQKDPNTVAQSLKAAADPHNRVFVVYLDAHFVRVDGSHDIRRPLVNMLDRVLAANDLFGLLTPAMRASDIAFARKTLTVEGELTRQWTWGSRDSLKVQPEGELAVRCYTTPSGSGLGSLLNDPTPIRPVPAEILERNYEDNTLERLDNLVAFLGRAREARSSVVVLTDGWRLFDPDETLVKTIADGAPASSHPPGVFVGPNGKLGVGGSRDADAIGGKDLASCDSEMIRLARLQDHQRFKDLIAHANRSNVTFYTVNPSGLAVWDASPASMVPDLTKPGPAGNTMSDSMDRLSSRLDSVQTLAQNTDGIAVINTNDLNAGLKRIVDEVSAYYLIGYYSTNTKLDGKYRRIDVRVKQPKIRVAARRGYVAGTEGDAISRTPATPTPAMDDEAWSRLAKLNPDAELYSAGTASSSELTIVGEVPSRQIEAGQWTDGGAIKVFVTDARGQAFPPATGRIDPGVRGGVVRAPLVAGSTGPWTARVVVTGSGGTLDDRVEIRAPTGPALGSALLFRGTPSAKSALVPVADAQFRKTERVHVEWPVAMPLDRREARLLGRNGQPLAVAVSVTERDVAGKPGLAADVNLAPLAPGDYVIELVAASGTTTERQVVPFRIVR